MCTSSSAQGGGENLKNRNPIGTVSCCDSRMAERTYWWTERWLELCFLDWLQWLQWSPHHIEIGRRVGGLKISGVPRKKVCTALATEYITMSWPQILITRTRLTIFSGCLTRLLLLMLSSLNPFTRCVRFRLSNSAQIQRIKISCLCPCLCLFPKADTQQGQLAADRTVYETLADMST